MRAALLVLVAATAASAGPVADKLKTQPLDPLKDADRPASSISKLEPKALPFKEIAVEDTPDHKSTHVAIVTKAGAYAMQIYGHFDGLLVDDISLHALVPHKDKWAVITIELNTDGGKQLGFIACAATGGGKQGKAPRCTDVIDMGSGDLNDPPQFQLQYPATGGITLVSTTGGANRAYRAE